MRNLWKRKLFIIPLLLVVMLSTLLMAVPASAATTAVVTVTNTPQYIAIVVDNATWTVNGLTGNSTVLTSTTYYSNPLGDTTVPSTTVVDGECRFMITSSSNVAIDVTFNAADMSGGSSPSTNGNTGSAGATSYGAYVYVSGVAIASKVLCKSSASAVGINALAASGTKKWGFWIAEQTNAWAGATASTFTITGTATAD
jgi:hypothetical protein